MAENYVELRNWFCVTRKLINHHCQYKDVMCRVKQFYDEYTNFKKFAENLC